VLDIDEDLCDGEPALSNPLTGREYDCNRGKDMCPAGSYCHKLGTIARCCKEGDYRLINIYSLIISSINIKC